MNLSGRKFAIFLFLSLAQVLAQGALPNSLHLCSALPDLNNPIEEIPLRADKPSLGGRPRFIRVGNKTPDQVIQDQVKWLLLGYKFHKDFPMSRADTLHLKRLASEGKVLVDSLNARPMESITALSIREFHLLDQLRRIDLAAQLQGGTGDGAKIDPDLDEAILNLHKAAEAFGNTSELSGNFKNQKLASSNPFNHAVFTRLLDHARLTSIRTGARKGRDLFTEVYVSGQWPPEISHESPDSAHPKRHLEESLKQIIGYLDPDATIDNYGGAKQSETLRYDLPKNLVWPYRKIRAELLSHLNASFTYQVHPLALFDTVTALLLLENRRFHVFVDSPTEVRMRVRLARLYSIYVAPKDRPDLPTADGKALNGIALTPTQVLYENWREWVLHEVVVRPWNHSKD